MAPGAEEVVSFEGGWTRQAFEDVLEAVIRLDPRAMATADDDGVRVTVQTEHVDDEGRRVACQWRIQAIDDAPIRDPGSREHVTDATRIAIDALCRMARPQGSTIIGMVDHFENGSVSRRRIRNAIRIAKEFPRLQSSTMSAARAARVLQAREGDLAKIEAALGPEVRARIEDGGRAR